MNDLVGRVISKRYRVDDFLGKGGMAEVYMVWDQKRSAHLAMKILHADLSEDKVFLRRFRREAQTLAKLQHPNIVRFYGLEQDEDLVYILMDYIEGTTLRKEIFQSKSPFSNERILEIMRPVCAALNYAHNSGFVHCDVKPANIMIHKNGTIYVSDFGIARMTEASTMTMVGAGTPAYMAPEQARGGIPTPRSDIYSLGVLLFELITGGERPFTGEHARITGSTGEKIRWEQSNLQPPSPRKFNPNLPSRLSSLIIRCLSKNPEGRYESALNLFGDLEICAKIEQIPSENLPIPDPKQANKEAALGINKIEKISGPKSEEQNELPETPLKKVGPSKVWLSTSIPTRIIKWAKSLLFSQGHISASKILKKKWLLGVAVVILGAPLIYALGNSRISVSPQSNRLYFTSDRTGKAEVYKLVGDEVIQVTHTLGDAQSWAPIRSNNGVIYFTSNRSGKAEVYKLVGNGVIQITHTPGEAQSWSPYRSTTGVIYFTSDRTGKAEIYKLVSDSVIQITHTPGEAQSWSPYRSTTGVIYFTSDRTGKAEAYKLVGDEVIQVTHTPGDAQSWAPIRSDNGVVYFTSDRNGKAEVYKLVGDEVVQVTHTPGDAQSWRFPIIENIVPHLTYID